MRERAVDAALEYFEVPNDGCKKDNRRLHEEVALFFNPGAVQVEHNRVACLVRIGNVRHELRIDGIAAVRAARVVKVDNIELGSDLILVRIMQQRVIGNGGEVVELVVVQVATEALGNHLADIAVDHRIGLARSRRAQHDGSPEGVDHIDPPVVHPAPVTEARRQVDGILVHHQPGLLHEALVLDVEAVLHQPVPEQTAHPQARLQQAEIADSEGKDIQSRDRPVREGEVQQPPVEKEQHRPGEECRTDSFPGNLFSFDTYRTQAGYGQQQDYRQLAPKNTVENSRGTVEVQQYPVHHLQRQVPVVKTRITVHIDMYHPQKNAHSPAEIHDFGKRPQIVFLLHRMKNYSLFLYGQIPRDLRFCCFFLRFIRRRKASSS